MPRAYHRRTVGHTVIRTALTGAGIVTMAAAGWLTVVDGHVDVSDGSAEAAAARDGGPTPAEREAGDTDGAREPEAKGDSGATQTAKAAADGADTAQASPRQRTLRVESGDTMITLLQDAGLSGREAFKAVNALKDVYEPRRLRPGQTVRIALEPGGSDSADPQLASLRLRASAERDVTLERQRDGGFVARGEARELTRGVARVTGTIQDSLMRAADRRDVPKQPLMTVIQRFSYSVDFQRDLRRGNAFEVVWERFRDSQGEVAKLGDVLYAALETRDEALAMYRFERDNGRVDYFNGDGESVRRLLMRTPINGARLSSGYGMREHPVLGYSRKHEGVDFAAPGGTPIYAAGNGQVEVAGWKGGYGHYVRIDHARGYETAYAHMKALADGVRDGAWVSQGDVIGYVGSSGSSTGTHLHYEIHQSGEPVNPRDLDLPTGYRLKGEELARFKKVKARIDRQREGDGGRRLAKTECQDEAHSGAAC